MALSTLGPLGKLRHRPGPLVRRSMHTIRALLMFVGLHKFVPLQLWAPSLVMCLSVSAPTDLPALKRTVFAG